MVVLYLVFASVHLGLSSAMSGPVVETDEAGYLGVASLLARGRGLIFEGSPYHPGYGAALWPVERLTSDPATLYRAALVLNALALAGLVVGVYLLTRWLVNPGAWALRTAIAVVVGVYPPFLAYGNIAIEINLFIPLCVFTAVAVAWAASHETAGRWAVAGLLAGACFVVHPEGGFVVVAALAIAGGARRPWAGRVRALVGVLAGIQAAAVPGTLLISRVLRYQTYHLLRAGALVGNAVAHGPVPATGTQSRGKAVVDALSRTGLVANHRALLGYEIAGQVWYLVIGSAGLAVIGALVAGRAAWRVYATGAGDPADFVGAFALPLVALCVVFASDRFIVGPNGTGQADALLYGRYNDHVIAVVLVLGAVQLARLPTSTRRAVLGWGAAAAAVIAGCGVVLAHGRTAKALAAPVVYANVFALQPLLRLFGRVDVTAITLVGAVVGVGVVALARWQALAALAPALVVGGFASGAYSARSQVTDSAARTEQRVILRALSIVDRVSGPPACVGYDLPIENNWTTNTDQLYLPTTVLHRFSSATGEAPCSELALSQSLDLSAVYPGARLMALENFNPVRLWVLPGPVQADLLRAGALLPDGFPQALPQPAYQSRITVRPTGGTRAVAGGQSATVDVTIANVGTGSPWPSRRGFVLDRTTTTGWVSVASAWRPAGTPLGSPSRALATGARSDLAQPLWPGDQVSQPITIKADDATGQPLAPGRYEVTIGLVQEGIDFFAGRGDPPVELQVDVI